MNRIFITGDVHGNIDISKLNTKHFPEQKSLTRDDYVIIAGDFGVPWSNPEDKTDQYLLKWHENKPYTTLFIDGNHENFDALETYPIVNFKGALCHQLRPHVYHVMRGEVLNIGEHVIWCMGGAQSHDKIYRTEFISWWSQEEPTKKEWDHAIQTFENTTPTIIVTHEGPQDIIDFFNYHENTNNGVAKGLNQILYQAETKNTFMQWFFGHHHVEREWVVGNILLQCLYDTIIEI